MKRNQIIEFEPRERILEKARKYVDSLELFSQGSDRAIPLLLKAIKYADKDLKSEIIILLGTFAKEEVAWPLYEILSDKSENEEIRNHAAIQLSVIGPFLKNSQPFVDRLL